MSDGYSDLSRNGLFGKGGYDSDDRGSLPEPPSSNARVIPNEANKLHEHFTEAELELALIRRKLKGLDGRISSLQAEAIKLRNELTQRERP